MRVNTDSFFSIGNGHVIDGVPCQDYALTCDGLHLGSKLAVVSDGCSASPDSDIGARILCHMLKKKFQTYEIIKQMRATVSLAHSLLKSDFNLAETCLDATLCYVTYDPSRVEGFDVHVKLIGDGSFFVKYKNHTSQFVSLDWEFNAPPYLNYLTNAVRMSHLLGSGQKGKQTEVLQGLTSTDVEEFEISMQEHLYDDINFVYDSRQLESISVMSDGMGQIIGKQLLEAIEEFNAFKDYTGSFVKRRAIRALKDLAKDGHKPIDDVSIATLHFDHEK